MHSCLWHLPGHTNKLCGHIPKTIWRVELHMALQVWPLLLHYSLKGHQEAGEVFVAVAICAVYKLYSPFCWERFLHFYHYYESNSQLRLGSLVEKNLLKLSKGKCRVLNLERYKPMYHCRLGSDIPENISEKELVILLNNFYQKIGKNKNSLTPL